MQDFLLFAEEHRDYTFEQTLDLVIKGSKGSRCLELLQELRFDKVGDLIWPAGGGEDLYPVGESDLLFADHRNHIDLACERINPRIQMSVELDLGKRPMLASLHENKIVVGKQSFDQLRDRLVWVASQNRAQLSSEMRRVCSALASCW